jgi:hypothetical protein
MTGIVEQPCKAQTGRHKFNGNTFDGDTFNANK